jgi:diphosphoinositol-polyphosphate diphosphatase
MSSNALHLLLPSSLVIPTPAFATTGATNTAMKDLIEKDADEAPEDNRTHTSDLSLSKSAATESGTELSDSSSYDESSDPTKARFQFQTTRELQAFCFPTEYTDPPCVSRPDITTGFVADESSETTWSPEDLQKISIEARPHLMELTVSRIGRELQRWGQVHEASEPNCRLTTGCVPMFRDGRILLISSSKSMHKLVLPKGGWEADESLPLSALRETLEEAGVTGVLAPPLPSITFETKKAQKRRLGGDNNDSTVYAIKPTRSHSYNRMTIFPLYVQQVYDTWPEHNRSRKIVTVEEAMVLLKHRPEFIQVLTLFRERYPKMPESSILSIPA